jgi:hypothetical protein
MEDNKDSDLVPSFRTEKYLWFRSKRRLELLDIDEELIEIPVLVQDAGECVAIANELRDSAKEEFDRTKANIAQQLRIVPGDNGKARSESTIDSQLPLYDLYKTSQNKLSQARLDAALWSSMQEAMRTKSSQIRVAADLLSNGFLTTDYVRTKRRREIRGLADIKE